MDIKSKPNKPFSPFPLTAYPNEQWCQKFGAKSIFCVWADPDAALKKVSRRGW
jgi:hypothetical protein